MAKKKIKQKSGSSGGLLILILLIFASAIVYLTLLSSLLFLMMWLYYELVVIQSGVVQLRDRSEFALTADEESMIVDIQNEIAPLKDNLDQLLADGQYWEDQKESFFKYGKELSLKQRNDGMFDSRSSKGQQLNTSIKEASTKFNSIVDDASELSDQIDKLCAKIDDIRDLENQRFQEYCNYLLKWTSNKAFQKTFRVTCSFYIILIVSLVSISPTWLLNFSTWLNGIGNVPIIMGLHGLYGAMFATSIISCFTLWLLYQNSVSNIRNNIMPDSWERW